jgi:hypothetical protein
MSTAEQPRAQARPQISAQKSKKKQKTEKPRWQTDAEFAAAQRHRQSSPDLGAPTYQRAQQSRGFSGENLAGGDGPRVVRSVERTPFTLPAVRERVTAEEIERAIRLKREADPMSKLTAVDRMLEEHEFGALAWYVVTHYRRESGQPARMRYDDAPRGLIEEGDRDDRKEMRWRLDLQAIEYVDDRLHEAGKSLLDMVAWQMFPNMREGAPPTKVDIGRMILKIQGRDRSEGGYEGYLRCMAQFVSEARAEFAVEVNRKWDRRQMAQMQEHRREAEKLFG